MPEEIETMDFWKKPPNVEEVIEYKRILTGNPVIREESTGTLELDTKMYATQGLTKEDMVKYLEDLFFKDRCPTDAEGAE